MDVDQIQKVFSTTLNKVQSLPERALSGLHAQLEWTENPWTSQLVRLRVTVATVVHATEGVHSTTCRTHSFLSTVQSALACSLFMICVCAHVCLAHSTHHRCINAFALPQDHNLRVVERGLIPIQQHKYFRRQEHQGLDNSSVAVMLREMQREVNEGRPFEDRFPWP